jgi:hypothetical protein
MSMCKKQQEQSRAIKSEKERERKWWEWGENENEGSGAIEKKSYDMPKKVLVWLHGVSGKVIKSCIERKILMYECMGVS